MKSSKYGISRIKNFNPMNQERERAKSRRSFKMKKKRNSRKKVHLSRKNIGTEHERIKRERERGK